MVSAGFDLVTARRNPREPRLISSDSHYVRCIVVGKPHAVKQLPTGYPYLILVEVVYAAEISQ